MHRDPPAMKDDTIPAETAAAPESGISQWEWLPPAAVLLFAASYFASAPGSAFGRFSFWVGLGLVPGALWRLAGRSAWNLHRIFFALALVGFVLENPALRPDADTLAKVAAHWELVVLGCAASFTQPLWGALRIHRLLVDSGVDITRRESAKLCLVGSFFNLFLPGATGGDAYRVYAVAKGYRARLGAAIASVTLDRFLGLPSLILVVLLGMAMDWRFLASNRVMSRLLPFIFATGVVCLVLVAYLALAGRRRRRMGEPAPKGDDTRAPGRMRRLNDILAVNVKRRATLPLTLFHGFLSHVACIASCLCFGLALGVEGVPWLRYFLVVPMAMTINAIPGAPGGVGQGELAMAALLDLAAPDGLNARAGVMIMLLFRLSNLLIGVAGGVIYALGKNASAAGDGKTAWR